MIARWIDLCARNRFLVFTGTLLLVLAGHVGACAGCRWMPCPTSPTCR